MSKTGRPGSDLHPRPEAGPLVCSELTKSQRDTARQVLQLLAGMAQASSTTAHYEHDLIRIDPIRHNRTILIDGSRGSGKTTLLISLLDALQRRFGQRADPQHPNEERPDWEALLNECNGGSLIVPVSLVDLAPLPQRSSLMLLLISCLESVVKRMEAASHGVSSEQRAQAGLAPFCHDGERLLPSRERWNELAAATIQGWDDHADNRTVPSDLESYAREQMTAEQQRLELSNLVDRFLAALQEDFRSYLHKVSRHRQKQRAEEPVLFLIAIDDADMNPERVAELLDALRVLGHRQLAFLLTGNKELFLESLSTWCLNALAGERAAATGVGQARIPGHKQLASQIYDKLIPTTHHFHIDYVAQDEESVFRDVAELRAYLKACPLLRAALPRQLRGMQNLQLLISRSLGEAGAIDNCTPALAQYLFDLAKDELEPSVKPERIGSVRPVAKALQISVPASVAARSLVISSGETWNQLPLPVQRTLYFTKAELPQFDSLESETAMNAALMLAAIAAMDLGIGTVRVLNDPSLDSSSVAGADLSFIEVALQIDPPLDKILPRSLVLDWPLPTGLSLHQQVFFLYHWNSRVGTGANQTERTIVARYLGLICAMGDFFSSKHGVPLPIDLEDHGFAALAGRIAETASKDKDVMTATEQGWQDWAAHSAVLLTAPEYGLSAEVANELLSEVRRAFGPGNWSALRASISQQRRKRIIRAVERGGGFRIVRGEERSKSRSRQAGDLIAYIDRSLPRYDWDLLLESTPSRLLTALLSEGWSVSDETLQLLEQGSVSWLRLLVECIASFVEKNATDRRLSESLAPAWRATGQPTSYAFTSNTMTFRSLAEEAPDLVLSRLRTSLQSDRVPPGKLLAQGRAHNTKLAISVTLATLPTFRSTDGQLSPLQEGLLHLLWDEQSDGPADVPLTAMKEWPSVALTIETTTEQIALSWPSAQWRTFAAAGAVTAAWNQAVEFLSHPGHRELDSELLDRLAFFYIRCCISVATARPMPMHLPESPPPERDWLELLERMAWESAPTSIEPLRFRAGIAIAELWQQVPRLAMPESGLSFAGVRAIIRFLQGHDTEHRHLLSALKLRRARLTTQLWTERESSRRDWQECQAAAERVLEYLEKIARNVDHPFQVWLDTNPKLQEILKSV